MKIQLETIQSVNQSPFRLLHNPHLNNLFYWHFHPEYELVFIEGASATRHVGDHISHYTNSDLVFIGSNIPHLNFDYGVQTDYHKEVLHINTLFKNNFLEETPEMSHILALFERSRQGIAFFGKTKEKVGRLLKELQGSAPFDQFLKVLDIFDTLAKSEAYEFLHQHPFVNRFNKKQQERLRNIYAYVDEHYQDKIRVEQVASLCHLTKPAFCRYFKKATGKTFVSFLNEYRVSQAKRLLMMGKNVSEACYECGFESLSYFNKTFKSIVFENPSFFKNRNFKNKN